MAQSTLSRPVKALRIVDLGECIPLEDRLGWYEVVDTSNGSGEFHIASIQTCDCADHRFRGRACKHILAVRAEVAALAEYTDAWDIAAAAATVGRISIPSLDIKPPTPVCMDTCPRCGAPLQPNSYKVGSRGYVIFKDCTRDKWHYSVEA